MYKYLFIGENGTILKLQEINADDLISATEAICDIIRLSDLKQFVDNEWVDIPDRF